MKAIKGYKKEDYRNAPVVLEFQSIDEAAEYLAKKFSTSKDRMIDAIQNDTNCDAIYFDDGSVILNEFV